MTVRRRRRALVLPLFLLAFLPAPADAAEPVEIDCPAGSLDLGAGSFVLRTSCLFEGDIRLSGTASLVIERTDVVVDGDILLSGDSQLVVRAAAVIIDNHHVLEHRLEARDRARLFFVASILSTNRSTPGSSYASQFVGYDRSVFYILDSKIFLPDSWLLADVRGGAAVHTIQSTNFPSEIYPHEQSTVVIEGDKSDHRVWLEFSPGSEALIEELPGRAAPVTFSFGRNTPGLLNVGYQVEIVDGIVSFGIASHPSSRVTLRQTEAPVTIGYYFWNVDTPQVLSGIGPLTRDVSLTHQNRLLSLDDASLDSFAWQVYAASPASSSPQPVHIARSTLNEIAALDNGRVSVSESLIQWAVIGALGPGSRIEITGSTINAQSVVTGADGVVHIDSSEIFGSIFQADGDSTILLSNNRLESNVCHTLCLPVCPSPENGGFEGGRCNPFNRPGADSTFTAFDRAAIVVLGVDPVEDAIAPGASHEFIGDAFVVLAPGTTRSYSYELRYRELATSNELVLVANGQGPRRGEPLGMLDTTGLAAGNYLAILELALDGAPVGVVTRPFVIAPN